MSKLPRVSGEQVVTALRRIGFRVRRQHGSHIIMRRDEPFAQTVVPAHRELDRGTLRAILRQIDLSVEDFTGGSGQIDGGMAGAPDALQASVFLDRGAEPVISISVCWSGRSMGCRRCHHAPAKVGYTGDRYSAPRHSHGCFCCHEGSAGFRYL